MQLLWSLSWLVQGLVAGVVTLAVLAVRAAIEGRSGVAFGDLWTALAVGAAVGVVPYAIAKFSWWRMRQTHGDLGGGSMAKSVVLPEDPASPASSRSSQRRGRVGSRSRGMDRFDAFSDRARQVLTYAQDESQRFHHDYIGTEHLLLGLIREGDGTAAHVLASMNVELPKVRSAVLFIIGRGNRPATGMAGLTPRAKRVIELAIEESRHLGHDYVGTEHLLLGLVREGEGIAAGVLASLDVNLDRVRHEVVRVIAAGDDSG